MYSIVEPPKTGKFYEQNREMSFQICKFKKQSGKNLRQISIIHLGKYKKKKKKKGTNLGGISGHCS